MNPGCKPKEVMILKNKLGIVGILLVVLVGNSGCAQHYGYRDGVKTTVYATAVPCDGEAAAIAAGAIKRIEAEPCPPKAVAPTYDFQVTVESPPPSPPQPPQPVVVVKKQSWCERVFGNMFRATVVVEGGFAPGYYGGTYWVPIESEGYYINQTRYLYSGRSGYYHQTYIPPYRSGPYPPVVRPAPYRSQVHYQSPRHGSYRQARQLNSHNR